MHPSHLLTVKQRVLQTEVKALMPVVDRMKRVDDPAKLISLLDRLNA